MLRRTVLAAALVSAFGVQASEITLYLSQPGKSAQSAYVAAAMEPELSNSTFKIERFDSRTTGALPQGSSAAWDVGVYTAVGGAAAIANAGVYGGAGGAGKYLSPGANGGVSVMLDKPARYFGFWWSAGDASNKVDLYDVTDTLVATFTTADLVAFLNKNPELTAVDGQTKYDRTRYYGNPKGTGNNNEPYAYLNFVLSDDAPTASSFKRIVFSGSNFELDNVAVRDATLLAQEFPPTWVETNPTYEVKDSLLAQDDVYVTPMDTPVSIQSLIANDTLPVKNGLAIHDYDPAKLVGKTAHGEITLVNGEPVFTPNPGFVGVETVPYTVCLNGYPDACTTATITILVNPVAPSEGTQTTPPVVTPPTVPGHTVTPGSSNGGTFDPGTGVYTPPPGFIGDDTITYTICEVANPSHCTTSTITVQIDPKPGDDTVTTGLTTPVSDQAPQPGSPDAPGLPVADKTAKPYVYEYTVSSTPGSTPGSTVITTPNGGTVTMRPDGNYTYVPSGNFVGEDSFSYSTCIAGSTELCGTATITVTVTPQVPDQSRITPANTPLTDTVKVEAEQNLPPPPAGQSYVYSVPDNDNNPATPVPTTKGGTVSMQPDGSYTYTPATGFTGTDTFAVQTCLDDGLGGTSCATSTVTVWVPLLDTKDDAYITSSNTPLTITPTSLLGNDSLPVQGSTPYYSFDPNSNVSTTGTKGTVSVDSSGNLVYVPAAGFSGDDTFTYTVCLPAPNASTCSTSTVTVSVLPAGGSQGNTGGDQTPVLPSPPGLTPNVPSTGITTPIGGTVKPDGNGGYTYTPPPGFVGQDTITYPVCDAGGANCQHLTVPVVVNPVPAPDKTTTEFDAPVPGVVPQPGTTPGLPDKDSSGTPYDYVYTTKGGTSEGGTVTMQPDGSYLYTPPPGFIGDDTFSYQVCLKSQPTVCGSNTVTVSVNPPAPDQLIAIPPGQTGVGGGFWDPTQNGIAPPGLEWGVFDPKDPSAGAVPSVPTVNGGTVTVNTSTGTFQYTPPPGFDGFDEFDYQVCLVDGSNRWCNTGTVQIVVPPVVPLPPSGNTVTGSLPQPDPANPTLEYHVPGVTPGTGGVTTGPTPNGSVTVTPGGDYTYTPTPGFSGEDVVTLESCTTATPPQCVTVQLPVRVPPVVPPASNTYQPGVPVGGSLTVTGVPSSTPRYELVTPPGSGTVVVNPDGSYTFTPSAGSTSTVTFTYRACLTMANGDQLCSDPATVTLTSSAGGGQVGGGAEPVAVPANGLLGLLGLSGVLGMLAGWQVRRRRR